MYYIRTMKKIFLFSILFLFTFLNAQTIPCVKIVEPTFSVSAKQKLEEQLAIAKEQFEKNKINADAIIWYGRRLAYVGKYTEAIDVFSEGIQQHPTDVRFLRHRAHRYLTVRCFDKAIIDLEKATALIKDKTDEVEQDGIPNAKNIPTSTLQSNIWYHLGLAYYVTGQFVKAEEAYKECLKVSKNPDMYVATVYWLNLTYLQEKKLEESKSILKTIHGDLELIENFEYLNMLLLFKGEREISFVESEMKTTTNTLSNATAGYGLAMYYFFNNNKKSAKKWLKEITKSNQWSSFGFIAAEVELKRTR